MDAFFNLQTQSPRTVVFSSPLSDDEFERMSERTELAVVERTNDQVVVIRELSGTMASSAIAEMICQLGEWAAQYGAGRALLHCGFFLPDGSCLSPDAAYVTAEQLAGLTRLQRARFLRLAPAFAIELVSESDRLTEAVTKMESWMANGVMLAWLVDPYAKQVHIYEAGAQPRIESGSTVAGSGPVQGFVLDADEVWRCYE